MNTFAPTHEVTQVGEAQIFGSAGEYVRIIKGYPADHWHLETKMDCYGGDWVPVPCSGVDNPMWLVPLKTTIEIMLWEQRLRLGVK